MKRLLLEVIFSSEKRKDALLLLEDSPQEMDVILKTLDTSRQTLLPQMKILEEHHLVSHYEDTYELTTIGKLVIGKVKPLLSTIEVFDTDINYWGTHDLSFIPPFLLKEVTKFGKYEVVNPSLAESFDVNKRFHKATKRSKAFHTVTSFLRPNFPELTSELIQNNVELSIIIDDYLLKNLLNTRNDEFMNFYQNKSVNIYINSKEIKFPFVSFNDHYLMLSLLRKDGFADNLYVLCNSKESIEWGNAFFEHYLKYSIPLTDI